MALISCPECGKEVSSHATACIYCGYPLSGPRKPQKNTWGLLKEIDEFYESFTKPKFTFENMRLPSDWKLW